MALRDLYGLDRTSAQFPDQLDQFFHDENHVRSIQDLPGDEFAELLKYLDEVLEELDHTDQPFRKCFQVLQKICGLRGILPLSYQLFGALSSTSELPVAFGGFCDVYKGKIGAGADVCIKKIRRCYTDNIDELRQFFCREAAVWKHLSHPNVVPFLGVTLEPLQLVSEWMPGGELRQHLQKNPNANLMTLLHGVAEGLTYLHSCNVIHGDLKGPNILVDESGNPRIADFGFATIARNPNSRRSTLNGDGNTARWSAPELLMNGQPATKESDIFSFGMVMVEVFTGKAPYGECRTPTVIASITTGRIPDRPDHPAVTNALWELILWCLKQAPVDRPRAEQVLAALKEMGRSRGVCARGPRSEKVCSLFNPSPRSRATRSPPFFRQRRNAGAKPPGSALIKIIYAMEGSNDEIAYCPVLNLCDPPHPHNRSNNAEKVPLGWHEDKSSETVFVQIPPSPQSWFDTKKHGLWCQVKSRRGVTPLFSTPKLLGSLVGFICCCR